MPAGSPSLARRDVGGIVALTLGVALIVIDMSIVNLVLPRIARDLSLGFSGLQYVGALFSLAAAAVVVAAGDLGDRIGARTTYVGGVVVFLAGSALAAAAPSEAVMLAARVLQGIGGGAAMAACLGVINGTYQGPVRGMAFGIYGATFAGASAAGPLIGAALAEVAGWRLAFGVNLVLGPLGLLGVLRLVPAVAPVRGGRRPDVVGTVLSSAGLVAVTFGVLQAGTYGWIHATRASDVLGIHFARGGIAPTAAAGIVAAVLFVAFVVVERVKVARGRSVILDPALLAVRSFTLGSLALLIVGIGEFGLIFLLPLHLEAGARLSAIQTGLLLLPVSVAAFVAFPIVQQIVAKTDARTAVLLGLAFEALGLSGIALAAREAAPLWMLPGLVVYGLGIGGATAQLSSLVLAEVPFAANSLASGVSSAVRQLGSSLGVAVLGVAFARPLTDVDPSLGLHPVQTIAALRAYGSQAALHHATDAVANGIFVAGLVAAAFLVAGIVAVRRLPRNGAWGAPEAEVQAGAPAQLAAA